MSKQALLLLAADMTLVIHVAVVIFVLFGLVAIYIGYFLKWSWVTNIYFRLTHLAAIGIVVIQSWAGITCPLTTWEMALRERAGDATYSGSFIQHWLQGFLYYSAPEWVFILCYSLFGALVLASWLIVKPIKKPS